MQYIGKDVVTNGSLLHLNRELAWQNLRSRAKQGIRKARKAGIRVAESRDLSQMEKLWYDPETLIDHLEPDQKLYLAYLQDELIGGIIVTPVTPNTLFYHFGGTNEQGRAIEANAYLFWHIVEVFHDSPFEFLDVGVSYRNELQHYFQKYCTQPYPIVFNPLPVNVRPRINIEPYSLADDNLSDEPVVAINTRLAEHFDSEFTWMPSWPFALQSALRALQLAPGSTIGVWSAIGEASYIDILNRLFGDSFQFASRERAAAALLCAHRWGGYCSEAEELSFTGTPLIEDCRDIFEHSQEEKPDSFGRFAIFDFTRWFPVPFGAVLAGEQFPDQHVWDHFHCLDVGKRNTVREALQVHWPRRNAYAGLRAANAARYAELFSLLGFEYLLSDSQDTPVFLLRGNEQYPAAMIGERLAKFEIATELDEQENLVALPCHCRLKPPFVDYIFGALRGMINPCHTYVRKDPEKAN